MSDSAPPDGPDPVERVVTALHRAMTEITAEVAESFRAAAEALGKIAQDPRVQAGLAADRAPGRAACHCLCGVVHRDSPGICDGYSVGTVRLSAMDVPMCAPCQAARAASKLSQEP
jgi:hypothetical protein